MFILNQTSLQLFNFHHYLFPFIIHFFKLIEMQIRIGNRKDVAGLRLLVNKNSLAVAPDLFLDLEDAFAFEHHGEDVGGGRVARVVLLGELAENGFGGVLLDGIHGFGRRGFVDTVPLGNVAGAAAGIAGFLGARFADIGTVEFLGLLKQNGAVRLFVGKGQAARFADVRAGLDVPFNHGRADLSTNGADEHEENLVFKIKQADEFLRRPAM